MIVMYGIVLKNRQTDNDLMLMFGLNEKKSVGCEKTLCIVMCRGRTMVMS